MATLYVSASGNDNNLGTLLAPKRTIAAGIGVMTGSDTLYVRGGTYVNQTIDVSVSTKSGTSTAYTKILGYPGERPIITQSDKVNGTFRGFYMNNSTGANLHHIHVENFEFDGVYNYYKNEYGTTDVHHVKFINNLCHDGVQVGMLIRHHGTGLGGDHLIQGNTFYRTGITQVGYPAGVNVIYGTGSRTTIEDNLFHDNVHALSAYDSSGTEVINNLIVRNNIVYNGSRRDLYAGLEGQAYGQQLIFAESGSGHLIYNNLIYDCIGSGIDFRFGAGGSRIYNNTFYNLFNYGTVSESYAIVIQSNAIAGNDIRNNIAYSTGGIADLLGGSTNTNNYTSNPFFVNTTTKDFHLTTASTANIGTGTNESVYFTTDLDGLTRTNPWDRGAYKYNPTGLPDTTAPATPTGLQVI